MGFQRFYRHPPPRQYKEPAPHRDRPGLSKAAPTTAADTMSTWNPPQPEKPVRRSTSVASPAASLLRLTVLSLATSGPVFIAPTLDALVPHGAKFTLAGKSGVSRATIADAFEAIYDESKGVVFHELREVDAMLVCSKVRYDVSGLCV